VTVEDVQNVTAPKLIVKQPVKRFG